MFSSSSLRTTWSYWSDVRDSGEKRVTTLIGSSKLGVLHLRRSLGEGRAAFPRKCRTSRRGTASRAETRLGGGRGRAAPGRPRGVVPPPEHRVSLLAVP